jgi:hypothetical protein
LRPSSHRILRALSAAFLLLFTICIRLV